MKNNTTLKRSQSAKNVNNVITTTDNNKYTTKLDAKHKGIKDLIKKKGIDNITTNNNLLQKGNFNDFFHINDKIGFRFSSQEASALNKEFNTIFVSTLLDICGEKTIDSGKEQYGTYVDLGKKDLFAELSYINEEYDVFQFNPMAEINSNNYTHLYNKYIFNENSFNQLLDKEKTIVKISLFTDLFSTDDAFEEEEGNKQLANKNSIMLFLSKNLITKEELKFASRFLCKIFLFQMYDRKAENIVILEDENGKIDFCDIDFDDNSPIKDCFVSTIFCQPIYGDDKEKEQIKKRWNDKLLELRENYSKFSELVKTTPIINKPFAEMIKNYTMTKEKIEEVIKKTAFKAKYMELEEEDVIKGIKLKIDLWKEMLNDKKNCEIVNEISCVKTAREETLKVLNKINPKDVETIVNDVMMFHDVTYDKPHFKDDNDILNKDHKKKHEDIASKACDMILAERKQKASFIIRFVADGSEIKTGDITAENLISYFKQEKDRSRRFFWVFVIFQTRKRSFKKIFLGVWTKK